MANDLARIDADRAVVKNHEQRLRRVENLGVETRAMIGERELRMCELARRMQELMRACADGLDELIREW